MQTITSNADSFGNMLISVGLQNRRPLPWMARQAEYPRLQAGWCRQPPGRLAENGAAGNIGTAVYAAAGTMLTAIMQASRPWSNRFP